MSCEEIRKRLGPWYDGELSLADAALVGDHLDGCEGCTALVDGWRQIDRVLGMDLASADLESAVMAAVHQLSGGGARRWVGIAAAALISAGLGALGAELASSEPRQVAAAEGQPTSLSALEESFAPGALAGIDDLADDILELSRRSR